MHRTAAWGLSLQHPLASALLCGLLAGAGAACGTAKPAPAASSGGAAQSANGDETAPAPAAAAAPTGPSRTLRVLLTTDEHGWLLPYKDGDAAVWRGGAVALHTALQSARAAPGATGTLLLSAGDMWTGPYESPVLEGAPMVAAMNLMGYHAAAVGNHEFDFGVRVLAERARTSKFPLLAANLVENASGAVPDWAKPYTIITVGELRVGVIGLTNIESPITSDARHMTGLDFRPYAEAIAATAPLVKAAGADVVGVLIHDRISVVEPLLPVLRAQGVRFVAAGHQHVSGTLVDDGGTPADASDDIVVCNPGAYMRSYCQIDLSLQGTTLTKHAVAVHTVERPLASAEPAGDPGLVAIVDGAKASAKQVGGELLATNKTRLARGGEGALGQMVVDSWLQALPFAQVAVTNAGGLRQDLEAGPVHVSDVVGVLPFNNYLLVVDLTGAQLRTVLENPESIASGVRYAWKQAGERRVVTELKDAKGRPIDDNARLKVIINDFMYRGGDRYTFIDMDPEPEETAVDWREPVFRRLRELGKAKRPLDVKADDRAQQLR